MFIGIFIALYIAYLCVGLFMIGATESPSKPKIRGWQAFSTISLIAAANAGIITLFLKFLVK